MIKERRIDHYFSGNLLVIVLCGLAAGACHTSPVVKNVTSGEPPAVIEVMEMPTIELHGEVKAKEPEAPAHHDPALWTDISEMAYQIGAGDTLMFRSFDDPELNQAAVVRYDGHISLPLIPDINVNKASRQEATERVRDAYKTVFKDPQISLTVLSSESKSYYVMGDIARPAEYPYTRRMTLLEAINTAGGLRINQRGGDSTVGAQGQLTKAIIIRHVEGQRQVLDYDLSNLSEPGPHLADAPVYPGDVVYIPEGVNLVYVINEAGASLVLQMTESMTVRELIARAGGYDERSARIRNAILMRMMDETRTQVYNLNIKKMLTTGQDLRLQAGDVLYIPKKPLVRLQEFVQRFTGSISPVLSLYTQAYDAWYTDDQWDRILEEGDDVGQSLAVINTLNDFGTVLGQTMTAPLP